MVTSNAENDQLPLVKERAAREPGGRDRPHRRPGPQGMRLHLSFPLPEDLTQFAFKVTSRRRNLIPDVTRQTVRAENVVHGPDQQGCLPAVRS
jgi:hypothetical protein